MPKRKHVLPDIAIIQKRIGLILVFCLVALSPAGGGIANTQNTPFAPGEKLTFQLRWENIPAGHAVMEVLPVKEFNGEQVYHFLLTLSSNSTIDIFYKVRDRFESYSDLEMNNSLWLGKPRRGKERPSTGSTV